MQVSSSKAPPESSLLKVPSGLTEEEPVQLEDGVVDGLELVLGPVPVLVDGEEMMEGKKLYRDFVLNRIDVTIVKIIFSLNKMFKVFFFLVGMEMTAHGKEMTDNGEEMAMKSS